LQGRKLPWTTTRLRQPSFVSLHRTFFPKPAKSLLKNLRGSYIWRHHDPVVHPLSVPASSYNSGATQVSQMPGDFGLRLIQNLHEIAHADFLISHEIQQPQPRVIAESLKEPLDMEALFFGFHENNYICIDECVQGQYSRFTEYVPKGER
jgi:hypothetical protein